METTGNKRFVYEFGKFLLDPAERTLFTNGDPVHLPAKEFDTLVMLVEHNGHVISKEEMMSVIWHDAFVEEANLAKQISRLRKVLNTNGNEFIKTLPKHGYRFSADLRRSELEADDAVILEKRTVKRVTFAIESETDPAPAPLVLPEPARSFFTMPRIVLIALIALVGISAIWLWKQRIGRASAKINTIAVLPLRSLNGDEDGKALGLGLADALITKLGSTHRVIVRPTNSVASFGSNVDPVETGRRLNVDAVLEGTIQEADGRLRVNARLMKTNTGEQIWADKFEQPDAGIFALQDGLSASIAKTLDFELSKTDAEQLAHRGTKNEEAYEKYLRGRFYQTQNTPDGLARSIELYQQAAVLDPTFAESYAGIADANVILYNFGFKPAAETIPVARQAVNRALQLDPDLSNAYTSLALIQFLTDRDWPNAEKSLQRALELDPNNADAYLRYGYFLINIGRFDDALEKLARARELNPLSSIVQTDTGLAYLFARKYLEAIEQFEKTVAEDPKLSLPQWLLGQSYEAGGDPERAFAANLKALELDGGAAFAARLRNVRETKGLDAANRLWFEENVKEKKGDRTTAIIVASFAATVKDREQTLYWIERSLEEGDLTLVTINYLAKYDFVRDDPRFKLVQTKLPL